MMRFIITVVFLFCIVSFLSLLWPRISNNPRPQPLASVYDILMQTSLGKQASAVLGVSDESIADSLSLQMIMDVIKQGLHARIHDVIRAHAFRYLTNHFNELPHEEREKILEELSKIIDQYRPSIKDSASVSTQSSKEYHQNN